MDEFKQRLYPASDPRTAKLIGKTLGGLRKLIFERAIPIVKVGGRVYLDIEDISTWIAEHRIPVQSGDKR